MRLTACLSSLMLALAALPARAQAPVEPAGVTAASNPAVEGTPPASTPRSLIVGINVFEGEHIVSRPDGQAQLLFRDGSSFTIGPNADLVLDSFAFDPQSGKGRMAASLGKGVFRFVGGKLSKDGSVTLTTPSAVLGVRGGIAIIEVTPSGGTNATLVFGEELSVRARTGAVERIQRPGFSISVAAPGAPPAPPIRQAPEQLRQTVELLRGQEGRAGGLAEPPPPPVVAASLRAPVAEPTPRAGAPRAEGAAAPAPAGAGQGQGQGQVQGQGAPRGPVPMASPFTAPIAPPVGAGGAMANAPRLTPPPPPPAPPPAIRGAAAQGPQDQKRMMLPPPPPGAPPPPPPPPP